jgi:hypothetical protein
MKENVMDGVCNTHGTDEKFVQTRNMKGRNYLEEVGIPT